MKVAANTNHHKTTPAHKMSHQHNEFLKLHNTPNFCARSHIVFMFLSPRGFHLHFYILVTARQDVECGSAALGMFQ